MTNIRNQIIQLLDDNNSICADTLETLTEDKDGAFNLHIKCGACHRHVDDMEETLKDAGYGTAYAEDDHRLRILEPGSLACQCAYPKYDCACGLRLAGDGCGKPKSAKDSDSPTTIETTWTPRRFLQCGKHVRRACKRFFATGEGALKYIFDYAPGTRRQERTLVCKYCYKKLSRTCKGAKCKTRVYQHNENTKGFCYECFDKYCKVCPRCDKTLKKTRKERRNGSMKCPTCGTHGKCRECRKQCGKESRNERGFRQNFDTIRGKTYKEMPFKRTFGIEVEVSAANESWDSEAMEEEVSECTRFQTKDDGSLSDGFESVSPILQGDNGLNVIEEICYLDWPENLDESCGLHVHLDSKDLSWLDCIKVARLYAYLEPVLYAMQPRSRGEGNFNSPIAGKVRGGLASSGTLNREKALTKECWIKWHFGGEIPAVVNDATGNYSNAANRYMGVNFQSHFHRRTVEIRYHSGTTNYRKIKNWILINQAIVGAAKRMPWKDVKSLTTQANGHKDVKPRLDLLRECFVGKGLDVDGLMRYVHERINKFAGRSACDIVSNAVRAEAA